MTSWLKLIGCSQEPITGPPFYGEYNDTVIGFRKSRKPGIRIGDHLLLYAPCGSKRIFALAMVTSDPEKNISYDPQTYGSCQWNISIRYQINLPVDSGTHIDEINVKRNLAKSIQRQSHIRLFPEEFELAIGKLQKIPHLAYDQLFNESNKE